MNAVKTIPNHYHYSDIEGEKDYEKLLPSAVAR